MSRLAQRLAALQRNRRVFDFAAGSLPSFARASTAWGGDSSGTLVSFATDVPRIVYDRTTLAGLGLLIEELVENKNRNSTMQGAAAGTPGTDPTNWSIQSISGITKSIVGQTTIGGIECTRIRWAGTSSGSGNLAINMEQATAIAAVTGDVWTQAMWMAIEAGSVVGALGAPRFNFTEVNSGGSFVTQVDSNISLAGSTLTRYNGKGTLSGGVSTAFMQPKFFWGLASGQTIDVTLVVGLNLTAKTQNITSSIKTSGSSFIRAADIATLTDPFLLAAGAYVVKARTPVVAPASGTIIVLFHVDDGSSNNRLYCGQTSDGHIHWFSVVGGVQQVDLDLGAVAPSTDFATSFRAAGSNWSASLNGAAVVSSGSGSRPTGLTTTRLGRGDIGNYWNSTIKRVEALSTASDAELRALAA